MSGKKIEVIQNIFDENDRIASIVNESLEQLGILVINIMGAPGAGKTSSIINMVKNLPGEKVYVIEGDIESDIDTVKLKELGIETIQINTNGACHLDAPTIEKSLQELTIDQPGILFIENIGNLVCPAEFQIGEHVKMLICSAAEGSDKPYKYPLAFEKANIILLTKCDLKAYVDFNDEFFLRGVRALNKSVPIFEVNAKTGAGFQEVSQWLINRKN
ncbi:MAG: Hydrogenase isoenzymes nickel incorporation protein HypB [Candidatus Dichloromethanomonas elyunquensis]|nr:MAG: Hydrogenase isoenzymes nickel incorporation protein HypB [Candidatus Dichloromethanomonas elyunquensis]